MFFFLLEQTETDLSIKIEISSDLPLFLKGDMQPPYPSRKVEIQSKSFFASGPESFNPRALAEALAEGQNQSVEISAWSFIGYS